MMAEFSQNEELGRLGAALACPLVAVESKMLYLAILQDKH